MAHYHCHVRRLSRKHGNSAKAHYDYIARLKKYRGKEDLIVAESGNMPSWATRPGEYWYQADRCSSCKGVMASTIQIALPAEITDISKQIRIVHDFISMQCAGQTLAWSYGIHHPKGSNNIHAHIMISGCIQDGIDRPPEQFFRQYRKKNPRRGGCRKIDLSKKTWLMSARAHAADVVNSAYRRMGIDASVDHRSYQERGINKMPGVHLGPVYAKMQARGIASDILAARKARKTTDIKEREQMEQRVSQEMDIIRADLAKVVSDLQRVQSVAKPKTIQKPKIQISKPKTYATPKTKPPVVIPPVVAISHKEHTTEAPHIASKERVMPNPPLMETSSVAAFSSNEHATPNPTSTEIPSIVAVSPKEQETPKPILSETFPVTAISPTECSTPIVKEQVTPETQQVMPKAADTILPKPKKPEIPEVLPIERGDYAGQIIGYDEITVYISSYGLTWAVPIPPSPDDDFKDLFGRGVGADVSFRFDGNSYTSNDDTDRTRGGRS